ncbi:MAG: hypothetical protein FVQ79_09285 [Planctomycetes bacterium]|nr:hypothetical protein [Planctomycetota bacterium]
MNSTVKKYALVVFITLLVWFWANNAIEDQIEVSVSITTTQTRDSDILVTFDKPMPLNVKITVKGPSSKISDLQKLIASGQENLDFVYSLQNDLKGEAKTIPLVTAEWLNQTVKMKSFGLTVESESAKPAMIQVTIEKLVKKELVIECFDEDGISITPDSLNPSKANIFVKQGWVEPARIDLTATDVEKAQKDYVIKEPYVQLGPNNRRYGKRVTVKLSSTELDTVQFKPLNISFAVSKNLQGKYKVELKNESELTESTTFKATTEAMDAYKKSPVHIFVLVFDDDEKEIDVITRDVIYNFPPEYLVKGEIALAQPPVKARFELIKLALPDQ